MQPKINIKDMNKSTSSLVRQVARLSDTERARISATPTDDLPDVLRDLGISLPASSWWLRVIKVILYAAGILLAGIGTASAATMTIL